MAGPIALLFATAGLALLVSAFLAQNVTLAGTTIQAPTSRTNRAVRAALGGVLLVAALFISGIIGVPPGPTPQPTPSTAPTAEPRPSASRTTTPTPAGNTTDCVITISNPLVTMYEQPDVFGPEVIRVPVGEYSPVDTTMVEFAGKQQRWYQISAEGRTGWVMDNTIQIARKSAGCQ